MTIRTIDSEIKELEIIVAALRHVAKQGIELDTYSKEDNKRHSILHRTLLPRYTHALEIARRSRNRIDYMRAMAHGEITQHIHHDRSIDDQQDQP